MNRQPTHWMVPATIFAIAALLTSGGEAFAKPLPGDSPGPGTPCPPAAGKVQPSPYTVTTRCLLPPSKDPYLFDVINITDGGELVVEDPADGKDGSVDIWARAIIVEGTRGEELRENGVLKKQGGGKFLVGTAAAPIGSKNPKTVVTIHLWGSPQQTSPQGKHVSCITNPAESCGAPDSVWTSNMDGSHNPKPPTVCTTNDFNLCVRKVQDLKLAADAGYPNTQDDYFYAYHPLRDTASDNHDAYFGNKVIAVSYGGTLQMFGKKGAIYGSDTACNPTSDDSTGRSWTRLAKTAGWTRSPLATKPGELPIGAKEITVVNPPCGLGWADGDDIVITTTDYLPGHSEQAKISGAPTDNNNGTSTITLTANLAYHHNGEKFTVSTLSSEESARLKNLGLGVEATGGAELRAAVGLLTRSIRIVSEGCVMNKDLKEPFPKPGVQCATPSGTGQDAYFGGHTVFRQGYRTVQIQGVEFYQMGQGGLIGHYPIHFHHARKTQNPAHPELDSFVRDSSIWDSMTRWIVLHGTSDVTLQRNVGYKSIGHGFYLEDGTEINNKLLANLGVFARGAVANKQNERKVPGILAAPQTLTSDAEQFPYKSDVDHPTVFWIMNGWNDFKFNMAAGAGTCGVCYWLVPGANSTMSRDLKWESYASMQNSLDRAGMTPLKSFIGNSCTTAMTSFLTVGATEGCKGVAPDKFYGANFPSMPPVANPLAGNIGDLTYYPIADSGGGRFATRCGGLAQDPHADCSTAALQPRCAGGTDSKDCMVTVLDRYVSSFNWAPFNFAAIWLRPHWYLVTDSVITDAQQAGLTMVTGGGYSASDEIPGHWALTRKTVFIGNSQRDQDSGQKDVFGQPILMPDNPWASNGGPFNTISKLRCEQDSVNKNRQGSFCASNDAGISFNTGNAFGVNQRLYNVYDGPAFQDSNAYFNIKSRKLDDCKPQARDGPSSICDPPDKSVSIDSSWWASAPNGLRRGIVDASDPSKDYCYMPNAAIGWKQPNGFYYPPAFHSTKLFFKDVDVRHFVVTPLFKQEGSPVYDVKRTGLEYCKYNELIWQSFTSIDRQTVLNDDDGTLTGYTGSGGQPSIVVNDEPFFTAPVEAMQCASDDTSKTSPYAHVSTVVFPKCALDSPKTCAVSSVVNNVRQPNPHTGDWDQECSNENCYGVPLTRLDVTKSDKGVPKSIRMSGQATGQRSMLTVNHGTYYIDTTASRTQQLVYYPPLSPTPVTCNVPTVTPQECNINVFQTGGTYYIFLIYAKEDTEQTYRFYVGPGKSDNPTLDMTLNVVQVDIDPNPPKITYEKAIDGSRVRWVGDKANGIVEVKFGAADVVGFADKMKAARKDACQPATYCGWDDKETVAANMCKQCTALKIVDKLDATGKPVVVNGVTQKTYACDGFGAADVCRWGPYDPHCPEGGCVGIQFTLPAGFQTGIHPDLAQIKQKELLCKDADFDVKFVKNSDGVCPKEATDTSLNDQLELNFNNVTPANCQDSTATGKFPRCSCP